MKKFGLIAVIVLAIILIILFVFRPFEKKQSLADMIRDNIENANGVTETEESRKAAAQALADKLSGMGIEPGRSIGQGYSSD